MYAAQLVRLLALSWGEIRLSADGWSVMRSLETRRKDSPTCAPLACENEHDMKGGQGQTLWVIGWLPDSRKAMFIAWYLCRILDNTRQLLDTWQ